MKNYEGVLLKFFFNYLCIEVDICRECRHLWGLFLHDFGFAFKFSEFDLRNHVSTTLQKVRTFQQAALEQSSGRQSTSASVCKVITHWCMIPSMHQLSSGRNTAHSSYEKCFAFWRLCYVICPISVVIEPTVVL